MSSRKFTIYALALFLITCVLLCSVSTRAKYTMFPWILVDILDAWQERNKAEKVRLIELRGAIVEYLNDCDKAGANYFCRESCDILLTDEQYDLLVECLSYTGNGKQYNFLMKKYIKETNELFLDHHGNRYNIVIDCNGDHYISGNLINGRGDYIISYGVVVWGNGKDGKQEYPFTNDNGGYNKDNVNGW